ncbi:MAG: bifunctional riboflavin kinase/FAD synthetase [Zoogloeaceae bacterium]|jgi:riboflavin kinase/FMN adenylyltransferase|nr:bifunctional riboflavin kinase/FAD synthetase [Zoogloeaceae bacterium]
MRVFRGVPPSFPVATPTVLAIGNFDGVHRGHLALLARLQEQAAALGLPATVITFEPHPREFFTPRTAPARLAPLREKLESLAAAGVAQTCVLHFSSAFAALRAEDFVAGTLVLGLKARHLIIGDDFRFGADRQGDFAFLVAAGKRFGFAVEAMPTVFLDGERISSSAVREALEQGRMERAAALLGRSYAIDGRVVPGSRLGRQLGFATANIHIRRLPLPMTGVFAVQVAGFGDRLLPGVANLGVRPTLHPADGDCSTRLGGGGERPILETHLLDFHGDLYGAHLSVRFVRKLRDEMKFPDLSALQARIAQDVAAARAFFENEHPHG